MISMNDLQYEIQVLKEQTALLERALNEVRSQNGLPAIQTPKAARGTHRPD